MVAAAPIRDPQTAAIAVMMVEFMDSGTGVKERNIPARHAWPDYREIGLVQSRVTVAGECGLF
jgi:hypothetical protein